MKPSPPLSFFTPSHVLSLLVSVLLSLFLLRSFFSLLSQQFLSSILIAASMCSLLFPLPPPPGEFSPSCSLLRLCALSSPLFALPLLSVSSTLTPFPNPLSLSPRCDLLLF
ncbi:hypothetical protein L6164_017379 [Bauhinia variegata]|uniref:Uncharacterized protein n=1 Tax=Bauhinia variegata TaxID=167791 RepID=A0ACB9N7S6_BAUVA|nr:hypothetical protein L6164_017379 [Bauhinia variegata]